MFFSVFHMLLLRNPGDTGKIFISEASLRKWVLLWASTTSSQAVQLIPASFLSYVVFYAKFHARLGCRRSTVQQEEKGKRASVVGIKQRDSKTITLLTFSCSCIRLFFSACVMRSSSGRGSCSFSCTKKSATGNHYRTHIGFHIYSF